MSGALKILIVDDEPDIIEYLSLLLERAGYEWVGAAHPKEALQFANAETFSIIITDMMMPDMSGLEMVPYIRASSHNAKTPIVVLSGALTDANLLALEKLGIIDVMSKPPDIDILLQLIQKAATKRVKKTGNTYTPGIIKIFQDAFSRCMFFHFGGHVEVSAPEINLVPLLAVEHCAMVHVFGRRITGVVSISFGHGFTEEFAKFTMKAPLARYETAVFEYATVELVDLVVQTAILEFKTRFGIHLEAMKGVISPGRFAELPLQGNSPRIKMTATLNNRTCNLEFALADLEEVFCGLEDKAGVTLIMPA